MKLTKVQKVEAIRVLIKVKEEIAIHRRSLFCHIFLCNLIYNITDDMKIVTWFNSMQPSKSKLTSKFSKHPAYTNNFAWWCNNPCIGISIEDCNKQRALFIDFLLKHLIGKSNG